MPPTSYPWTLERLTTKIQDDLELHEENFVTPDDIHQYINDAIDDAEETIIDLFSDFFITFKNLEVVAGQEIVPLPVDMYEGRMRGLFYNQSGFTAPNPNLQAYKLRKIPLEEVSNVQQNDDFRYRLMNPSADAMALYFYPAVTEDSTDQFRVWYIRQAQRLFEDSDVLEKGLRPQFILAHAKWNILDKMGDPAVIEAKEKYDEQLLKMTSSLSRLTDDDEDAYLEPDMYALSQAYGEDY